MQYVRCFSCNTQDLWPAPSRRDISVRWWATMTEVDRTRPAKIGHGLRERLLLVFVAISSFAVVAAVVGNYAFYAIGEALHQVTEKSVPPAIATLELAQRPPSVSSPQAPRCLRSRTPTNSRPYPRGWIRN